MITDDDMKAMADDIILEQLGLGDPGDLVNRPSHYCHYAIEPIEFIMHNGIDFPTGNIIKYAVRAGYKNYHGQTSQESAITDLKKVIRYAQMRINLIEGKEEL